MFDNILSILLGYPAESCDMQGRCSGNAVVEAYGSVYPCDFYVIDHWKLGNINSEQLEQMLQNDITNEFIAISENLVESCNECSYYTICRGGCRRHREHIVEKNLSVNYFCSTYKTFYEYSLPRFKEIAKEISQNMRRL